MGDTTPAAFDPMPKHLANVKTYKAGAAILAGQLVSFHGTGVDQTVHPTVDGTTTGCVGVALHSQASTGGYVAVAGNGTVCKLCEGAGSAIDAGDGIMYDSVAGCVITGVDSADCYWVGWAEEDITANKTGYCTINIQYVPKGA